MNDHVSIPVRHGVAIVDAEDAHKLEGGKWYIDTNGYVARTFVDADGKRKKEYLHRIIKNTPKGMLTDHVNRVRHDNRSANLRDCTYSQNRANARKKITSVSRFKGVCFDIAAKGRKKWVAVVQCDDFRECRWCFTELEAAHEYNAMAKEHFGEFALLNDVENNVAN